MTYIDVPIVTDPDDLAGQAFDAIQSRIPGWLPNDGNLETILVEALALLASVVAFKASGEPRSIFRFFGPLVGIVPIDATQATAPSTWTAIDTQGYTITAGQLVGIRTAGDELVGFKVLNGVDILPGESTTDAGAVVLVAVNAGAAGSGLGTMGGPVETIDPLDWVSAIVQTQVTTGGVDAETDQAFLDRLRSELGLLTPRPILPPEFAALARTVAGVYRAVAIDGYNPGDDSSGNPRMVAVAAMDAGGNAVGSTVKTAVSAYLESLREVNFVVNAMDPTFTEVDVTYRVAAAAGFDPVAVVAAVDAAIASWLSALNWGLPPTGDRADWVDNAELRYLDLVYVVRRVPGVDHIDWLTFNVHVAARTFTVTIASPAVFTLTGHGLSVGDPVILETTGALPTGLEPDTVYYVQAVVDADTFKLAATAGGAAINTSGTQSGVQSLFKTGTADITMTGPASLPKAHTITGTHA